MAEPLRQALLGKLSVEQIRRINQILGKLGTQGAFKPEAQRLQKAVLALELADVAETRAALEALTKGESAGAKLAAAALQRMQK